MNLSHKIIVCVFALTTTALASAAELGRLFYTPEQRAQMNYDHVRKERPEGENRSTLSVTGIVQKHGGDRTIWVNGVPKPAGKSEDRSPESAAVTLPGQKKPVRVKVGQKVYINPATPEQ